jgi:perosamine synthetase
MKIPITRPVFGAEELRAVQLPLESEWVVQGPFVQQFEERFASYVGTPEAVATSSCTTALHVILAALGVGPGDEVIVPAFTWVSTANVVEHLGAKPVFCDVDLATYNIDTELIAGLVTERTVGIMPVHLFGLCCDMEPVLELARQRGLWVVEDAACALGGWYHGDHAGTLGIAGAFSFHPRKSITTGEGGMVTTGDAEIAALCRSLRDHGASRSDHSRHTDPGAFLLSQYRHLGFNVRMTDIQGALGCAQMDRVDAILDRRRELAARYDEQIGALDWLATPQVPDAYVHGYQAYVCLFQPDEITTESVPSLHERRNRVMQDLEEAGIATRQGTHAAALTGYYAEKYGIRPEHFPNAYAADRLTLALPLYPQLADDEQDAVFTELAHSFASV